MLRKPVPAKKHYPKLAGIPARLVEIAQDNLEREGLRRWWCKKYRLPPTDARYLAYAPEQLIIEFLEDVLDRGIAKEGIQKTYLPDGTPIAHTGDPVIDADELRHAMRSLQELEDELRRGIVKRHELHDEDADAEPATAEEFEDAADVLGGFHNSR